MRILIATDGSQHACRAIDYGVKLAARTGAEVLSAEDVERFHARLMVVRGSASAEITNYALAEKIDLIVLGTHGRSPIAHMLMGSVAEKVVRKAPCPVLVVRGEARLD